MPKPSVPVTSEDVTPDRANGGTSAYYHALRRLCKERVRLLEHLAPLLSRVSPKNPKRAKLEKLRTIQRKAVRAQIYSIEQELISVVAIYVKYKDQRHKDKRGQRREYMQKYRFKQRTSYTDGNDE